MAGFFLLSLFFLGAAGVFGVEVSVKEGDSVTLNSDVTKQPHEPMRWYFNNILIVFINDDRSTSCLYDGEGGIFRDRLEVNYETGSLTITNIRSENAGHYELEYGRRDDTGTSTSLNRNSKCNRTRIIRKPITADDKDIIKSFRLIVTDSNRNGKDGESEKRSGSGPSAGAVAGIVAVVLLVFGGVVVVGVIYYRRWRSRNERERNNQELLQKIPPAAV